MPMIKYSKRNRDVQREVLGSLQKNLTGIGHIIGCDFLPIQVPDDDGKLNMEPSETLGLPERPTPDEMAKASSAALDWIEGSLKAIYVAYRDAPQAPTIDRSGYLGIYNAVHEYCRPTKSSNDRHRGAHLRGRDVYDALERQITIHCKDLAGLVFAATALEDGLASRTLIQSYLERWERLGRVAGLVGRLLRPLDRHFTTREIDEQSSRKRDIDLDVHEIEDLHKKLWKQEVLKLSWVSHDLAGGDVQVKDAVEALQKRVDDESVESGDEQELLENFVRCLTFLGVRYPAKSLHDFRPVVHEKGFG